jgi:hypothetical protein
MTPGLVLAGGSRQGLEPRIRPLPCGSYGFARKFLISSQIQQPQLYRVGTPARTLRPETGAILLAWDPADTDRKKMPILRACPPTPAVAYTLYQLFAVRLRAASSFKNLRLLRFTHVSFLPKTANFLPTKRGCGDAPIRARLPVLCFVDGASRSLSRGMSLESAPLFSAQRTRGRDNQ